MVNPSSSPRPALLSLFYCVGLQTCCFFCFLRFRFFFFFWFLPFKFLLDLFLRFVSVVWFVVSLFFSLVSFFLFSFLGVGKINSLLLLFSHHTIVVVHRRLFLFSHSFLFFPDQTVLLIFDRRCKKRNVAVCGTILWFFLLFFLFFWFWKASFQGDAVLYKKFYVHIIITPLERVSSSTWDLLACRFLCSRRKTTSLRWSRELLVWSVNNRSLRLESKILFLERESCWQIQRRTTVWMLLHGTLNPSFAGCVLCAPVVSKFLFLV